MSNNKRLALDVGLFSAILIAARPESTGLSLHEWLGFAIILPALLHLVLNWNWVEQVVERLFERLRAASRLNLVVDIGLFVSLVAVTVSGIALLPLFAALSSGMTSTWRMLHGLASDATVAFTVTHLVLHVRWIAGVVRRATAPDLSEGLDR